MAGLDPAIQSYKDQSYKDKCMRLLLWMGGSRPPMEVWRDS
jgi:hypothetical protein